MIPRLKVGPQSSVDVHAILGTWEVRRTLIEAWTYADWYCTLPEKPKLPPPPPPPTIAGVTLGGLNNLTASGGLYQMCSVSTISTDPFSALLMEGDSALKPPTYRPEELMVHRCWSALQDACSNSLDTLITLSGYLSCL